MSYILYDENNEVMRIVGRQEEARYIVSNREGWSFKCVRNKRPSIDWNNFEEALI